jgi:hypothetical protein
MNTAFTPTLLSLSAPDGSDSLMHTNCFFLHLGLGGAAASHSASSKKQVCKISYSGQQEMGPNPSQKFERI